jgi:hypothetical protein
MSRNYRVIELAPFHGEHFLLHIHEVYYDDKGKPIGYITDAVTAEAKSIEGMHCVLDRMRDVSDKPILKGSDLEKAD